MGNKNTLKNKTKITKKIKVKTKNKIVNKNKSVNKTKSTVKKNKVSQNQVVQVNIHPPVKKQQTTRRFYNAKQTQMNTPNIITLRSNDNQHALNNFMGIQKIQNEAQRNRILQLTNNVSQLRRELQMQGPRALDPGSTNMMPREETKEEEKSSTPKSTTKKPLTKVALKRIPDILASGSYTQEQVESWGSEQINREWRNLKIKKQLNELDNIKKTSVHASHLPYGMVTTPSSPLRQPSQGGTRIPQQSKAAEDDVNVGYDYNIYE